MQLEAQNSDIRERLSLVQKAWQWYTILAKSNPSNDESNSVQRLLRYSWKLCFTVCVYLSHCIIVILSHLQLEWSKIEDAEKDVFAKTITSCTKHIRNPKILAKIENFLCTYKDPWSIYTDKGFAFEEGEIFREEMNSSVSKYFSETNSHTRNWANNDFALDGAVCRLFWGNCV